MANYTDAEVLNEVSRIFRARIDPGREGGTLNTKVEYDQLLETASLTFLLNNDAIFYVAKLVKNQLLSQVQQEINLLEDTLLALDHLAQIGSPVRDVSVLSNAQTALLSLDAAGSVKNRPETQRFSKLMDSFADLNRKNVISDTTNQLVRPREEARNVLQKNLERLKKVHSRFLDSVFALRDLVDQYLELDIPSKVASTAMSNVRSNLSSLEDSIQTSSDADNIAQSRSNVLTSMASKVAVESIAAFSDPRTVKIRTPINPVPATAKHLGQVTGDGDPPSVLSYPGPWPLPLSEALVLRVNGGGAVSVNVDEILGTSSKAKGEEPFAFTADKINLHVQVGPKSHEAVVSTGATTSAVMDRFLGLDFRTLGTPITFATMSSPATDAEARVVSDLRLLQTGTVSGSTSVDSDRWQVSFSSWSAGDESGVGLLPHHEGGYLRQPSPEYRWEILKVLDSDTAIVSAPAGLSSPPGSGSVDLRGDISSLSSRAVFVPALTNNATGPVFIAAPVKTAQLSLSPDNDVAGVVQDVQDEEGDIDKTLGSFAWRSMTLHRYVQVQADPLRPTRIQLIPRSSKDPFIAVTDRFLKVTSTPTIEVVTKSAHEELGMFFGQGVASSRLSALDLAEFIQANVAGVVASVERTTIATGTLNTVAGSSEVTAPELDGVVGVGDELVLEGTVVGTYSVLSLGPITLEREDFPLSEEDVSYRVIRSRVRVSTSKKSRGSSLEVVSRPDELGFPVGVVKGSIQRFEAVDKFGNRLSFDGVFPGDILDIAGLPDTTIDNVNGDELVLNAGLPSDTEGEAFEIRGSAAVQYEGLTSDLITFTTSRRLLKQHGFDEDLDELDVALTRALLPGQNFASSRNQAKRLTADLLSILTSQPRRSDEYSTDVPTAPLDLESILQEFNPPQVGEIDSLVDTFLDRKYERSARLLQSGKIQEFFGTNEETGSFAGAVLQGSRKVVQDLPALPVTDEEVDSEVNVSYGSADSIDAEFNLGDSEVVDVGRRR
jgi:hypothetical protein